MSTQKSSVHGHDPKFLFPHRYKTVLSVHIKTHLSGPPMPKFEANMNYIHPSPPSSMKQCNKSATVKFHMELLLIWPWSNLAVVRHHLTLVTRSGEHNRCSCASVYRVLRYLVPYISVHLIFFYFSSHDFSNVFYGGIFLPRDTR